MTKWSRFGIAGRRRPVSVIGICLTPPANPLTAVDGVPANFHLPMALVTSLPFGIPMFTRRADHPWQSSTGSLAIASGALWRKTRRKRKLQKYEGESINVSQIAARGKSCHSLTQPVLIDVNWANWLMWWDDSIWCELLEIIERLYLM
jgi:hypothetical protein